MRRFVTSDYFLSEFYYVYKCVCIRQLIEYANYRLYNNLAQ